MNKAIITILTILLTSTYSTASDINTFLTQAWQEAVGGSKSSKTYNEAGRLSYDGGGYSFRAPRSVYQPISANIRGPSVKAGCSGIDLNWGGFNFVYDKDQLQAFLQAIMAGAPGYVFNLAVSTFCPSCADIMNKINDIANQLNGLQLDACSVLESTESFITSDIQDSLARGKDNAFNKSLENITKNATEYEKSFKNYIKSFYCDPADASCALSFLDPNKDITFVDKVMSNSYFKDDNLTIDLVRAIMGDLWLEKPASSKRAFSVVVKSPYYGDGSHKELIKKWIGQCDNASAVYDNITVMQQLSPKNFVITPIATKRNFSDPGFAPICLIVDEHFTSIKVKVRSRLELSQTEIQFLTMFGNHLFNVVNSLSVEPTVLDSYLDSYRSLASAQVLYELTLGLAQEWRVAYRDIEEAKNLSGVPAELKEELTKAIAIDNQLQRFLEATYSNYVDEYALFMSYVEKTKDLQRMSTLMMVQVSRHPLMGSYMLSKSLSFGMQ